MTTLDSLFAERVRQTPDSPAICSEDKAWSYRELDTIVDERACQLSGRGARRGELVGVLLPRHPDTFATLLGIARTGAAPLPLDARAPAERIRFVVRDAAPVLVIAGEERAGVLPDDVAILPSPSSWGPPGHIHTPESGGALAAPDDLAYVLYTSGSTGTPKGVMVTHAGLAHLAATQQERLRVGPDSVVLQFAPLSFDASVWEMLMAFSTGASLFVPSGTPLIGTELLHALRQGVTHATLPPSVLATLPSGMEDELTGLTTLVVAGEACSPALSAKWSRGRRFINAYGPTESTVCVTMSEPLEAGDISIGHPVLGTEVHVLDDRLRHVPPGVPGELYVSSAGVARGYLGRSGLTAQHFVADPFGPQGSRLYRTGDLVRSRGAGEGLDYIGRADSRVKIRGFRVELSEVEAQLNALELVDQAVATVREDRPGDPRLVAHVVPQAGAVIDRHTLRQQLAEQLPDYMVPSALVALDRFPLSANGKIDRDRLPPPGSDDQRNGPGEQPRDSREAALALLVAEVLSASDVGVEDNFFELGGNSLLATRLLSRIQAELGAEIPVRAIFEAPTVAGLAQRPEMDAPAGPSSDRAPSAAGRTDVLPLSPVQLGLWNFRMKDTEPASCNMPLAVRFGAALDEGALRAALDDIIYRHESLRTRFISGSEGPYQVVEPASAAGVSWSMRRLTERDLPAALREEANRPFDLATENPVRAALLRLRRADVLVLVFHHISADGWSIGPLARDLREAYAARLAGQKPQWDPLPAQYADYTRWQRDRLGLEQEDSGDFGSQVAYWLRKLDGVPEQLELPADRPRPTQAEHRAGHLRFDVDALLHRDIVAASSQFGVTVFMTLQAAFSALLTRLGAGCDIPLGFPIAGRTNPYFDDLVGLFANTLVLRVDTSRDPRFSELLARVRDVSLDAYANQDAPFEHVVRLLQPHRRAASAPLCQVMLVVQNVPEARFQLGTLKGSPEPIGLDTATVDLGVSLTETMDDGRPAGISGAVEFSADLFEKETVVRLMETWKRFLACLLHDPDRRIGDIDPEW